MIQLALGGLLQQVGRWLAAMFVSKWFVQAVVKVLAYLGLAFATKEALIDPVMSMVQSHFQLLGAQLTGWISAFGVDHALSVYLSFVTVSAAAKVYMTRVSSNG